MKGNNSLFKNVKYHGSASGDVSYMGNGNNSLFAKYVSKRSDIDIDGNFDVIAHGGSTYIQIESAGKIYNLSARDAAKLICKAPGYKKSKSVRLLSCNTGSIKSGFAQNLANALGKPVYAPNNFIWADSSGKHFIAGMLKNGRPDFNIKGEFIKFVPGGNKYVK